MADIQSIPALGKSERFGFIIVGGVFLWVSYLLVSDDSWTFPAFILPLSGYVTFRGVVGHELKIRSDNTVDLATPEGLVSTAENELTNLGRKLLALDICFAILVLIIELVFGFLGALASSLS
ncbi:hypothetical protein [Pelagicoccus albus]|nr:hypothetical protein [Pelagicoccus albus]